MGREIEGYSTVDGVLELRAEWWRYWHGSDSLFSRGVFGGTGLKDFKYWHPASTGARL